VDEELLSDDLRRLALAINDGDEALQRRQLSGTGGERATHPRCRDQQAAFAQHPQRLGEERAVQVVEDRDEVERLVVERQGIAAFEIEDSRVE
jgi:hypothetical protein